MFLSFVTTHEAGAWIAHSATPAPEAVERFGKPPYDLRQTDSACRSAGMARGVNAAGW